MCRLCRLGNIGCGCPTHRAGSTRGGFEVVSPLDGEHKTEIELSEEQEGWLEWLVAHRIERQRVE